MSYHSKFTQDEFNSHHKEFIANYSTKYRLMNLDFKMVMFMKGMTNEEFDDKMGVYESVTCNYSGLLSTQSYNWVDGDDDDYDSFSDGRDSRRGGEINDANEY
tara:strand:+ start:463 stop:771 length:309 start_codon:yes stop_codon:yes gene_type:complete